MAIQENNTQYRNFAPFIKDAIEFQLELPPYDRHVLKNGMEVYAINQGNVEAMLVACIFEAGNWRENKKGIAAAANALLKNGTTTRSAFEINDHFEYYGAHLGRRCGHETAEITLHCLNKHVNELLPVVAEMITDSIYPDVELSIYKKNSQQRLQVNLKRSDFVSGRLLNGYLYGQDHPYGRHSTIEDLQVLQQEDVMAFYRQYYQNGACRMFVAGKLPPGLIQQLEEHFGHLRLHTPLQELVASPYLIQPASQRKYNIINDLNGIQASIRIARNLPNRHHPDLQKLQVLNILLGGYFGSRLMANIREEKGYTYNIQSYLAGNRKESALIISTEVDKEVCEATINEIYKEMTALGEKQIDNDELQRARNFAIGSILSGLDGPFHIAEQWNEIILNGLNENYFNEGIRILKTITSKELKGLAEKYLNPADFFEVVVV